MELCEKLEENVIKKFERVSFQDIALTTIKDVIICDNCYTIDSCDSSYCCNTTDILTLVKAATKRILL